MIAERDDVLIARIARNVTALLERRRMSQAELSQASGENPMYVSRVCRGKVLPNAIAMARIAEALNTTVEALMASGI